MRVNETIGTVLEQSNRSLAAFAAEQLIAELERESGPDHAGFRYWHAFFEGRIIDLAAAVDAGQPRLFLSQARWCRAAMKARGIAAEQVRGALAALRSVVAAETGRPGEQLATDYIDPAIRDCGNEVDLPDTLLDVTTDHGRLAAQFVLSVLEGHRLQASQILRDAVADGLPVREAYLNVLVPAVCEIGRMWHMSELTVAEEHFASDTAQSVIAQLQAAAPKAPPNGRTVLAASVAGNRHDMGTRVLANLFEIEGWRVVCLGADMPGADIAQAVVDFEPDLLLLSATMYTHLRAVQRTISLVRSRLCERPIRILVGGRAFDDAPELAERYGADGYARTAGEAMQMSRNWLGT